MNYEDLTPEEQAAIDSWLQIVRPAIGMAAKMLSQAEMAMAQYESQAQAAVGKLSPGSTVPNKTGLADASAVSKEDIVDVAGNLNALIAAYTTAANRQQHIRFAGVNAMVK